MWPSAAASNRGFSTIPCPYADTCSLPNCIFSHELPTPPTSCTSFGNTTTVEVPALEAQTEVKRSIVDDGTDSPDGTPSIPKSVLVASTVAHGTASSSNQKRSVNDSSPPVSADKAKSISKLPQSVTRPVSPPPNTAASKATPKVDTPVSLMPRKVAKEPVPFNRRITFLKALHGYLKTQNDRMLRAVKPEIKTLYLSPNQLNKLAVDEEERLAIDNPSVYENLLKQRLVKLKSMAPEAWVKERREMIAKENGGPNKKQPPKRVDTGLSPSQELIYLPTLVCSQEGLDKHGYVTEVPPDSGVREAQLAQEVADFWEICDRCGTRFQAFPERRQEDGAFTTRGPCRYHWGKRLPPKSKKSGEPTRWACCQEPLGSEGCTTHDTHVFKITSPNRLSLVMPFAETPEQDKPMPPNAVCFDCEMGYTTLGFEMLRLTVLSWPDHRCIIDVLVRPLGHVLDLNTRFSGITTEQFTNAEPFDPENPKPIRRDLRMVQSPYEARDLFFSHITPKTPILGHALENDLTTVRIVHPTIIDTVLLFPMYKGLPYRNSLRNLAKFHLGEDIQQGGSSGHDSYEDARTTGELVRAKIKHNWSKISPEGWTITEDGVLPPIPTGAPPAQPPPSAPLVPSMVPAVTGAALTEKSAEKRKADDLEPDEDEVTAPSKSLKTS